MRNFLICVVVLCSSHVYAADEQYIHIECVDSLLSSQPNHGPQPDGPNYIPTPKDDFGNKSQRQSRRILAAYGNFYAAVNSAGNVIELWTDGGRLQAAIDVSPRAVRVLKFSGDGSVLGAIYDNDTLDLWYRAGIKSGFTRLTPSDLTASAGKPLRDLIFASTDNEYVLLFGDHGASLQTLHRKVVTEDVRHELVLPTAPNLPVVFHDEVAHITMTSFESKYVPMVAESAAYSAAATYLLLAGGGVAKVYARESAPTWGSPRVLDYRSRQDDDLLSAINFSAISDTGSTVVLASRDGHLRAFVGEGQVSFELPERADSIVQIQLQEVEGVLTVVTAKKRILTFFINRDTNGNVAAVLVQNIRVTHPTLFAPIIGSRHGLL